MRIPYCLAKEVEVGDHFSYTHTHNQTCEKASFSWFCESLEFFYNNLELVIYDSPESNAY